MSAMTGLFRIYILTIALHLTLLSSAVSHSPLHYVDSFVEDELVTVHEISHRSPGSAGDPLQLYFSAFNQTFNLVLKENNNLISNAEDGLPVVIATENGDELRHFRDLIKDERVYQDIGSNAAFLAKRRKEDGAIQLEGIIFQRTEDIIIFRQPNNDDADVTGPGHVVYRRRKTPEVTHIREMPQQHELSLRQLGFRHDSFDPSNLHTSYDPASLMRQDLANLLHTKKPDLKTGSTSSTVSVDVSMKSHSISNSGQSALSLSSEQQASQRNASNSWNTTGSNVKPTSNFINATVEAFVWTDYSFYESYRTLFPNMSNTEEEILRYVVILANAADLRFKKGLSDDPTINVSLALTGTLICKNSQCSRFTEDYRVNDTVDNHQALDHFADQLKQSFLSHRFPFRYDFAAALTRLDITDPNGTPIGVAFTDEICAIATGESSAVIEAQGGFSAVGTFVHELSHTLGADHDGWFRGIGCNSADGYIMSIMLPLTPNGFHFSSCSIQSMKDNLLLPNASCLFDQPKTVPRYEAYNTQLPGQVFNRTEQCRQLYGTNFCLSIGTTLEDICYKMYCWDPVLPNVCSTKTPAALGTSCGPKKWCIGGACVHDNRAP